MGTDRRESYDFVREWIWTLKLPCPGWAGKLLNASISKIHRQVRTKLNHLDAPSLLFA
jgi:hypothetical protein